MYATGLLTQPTCLLSLHPVRERRMSRERVREKDDNYILTPCIHALRILSVITAGCPMVGTPINLVWGLTRLGLIKDLKPLLSIDLWNGWKRDSTDSLRTVMARLRSLIRPSLISPQTNLIGVLTIGLPAVIMVKIPLKINNLTQLLSSFNVLRYLWVWHREYSTELHNPAYLHYSMHVRSADGTCLKCCDAPHHHQ